MRCPDCDDRLSVIQTIPWEGRTWRRSRCASCENNHITVESFAVCWPDGLHRERSRAKRAGASAKAGWEDAFQANAGADLAGLMRAFVAPTQQNAKD